MPSRAGRPVPWWNWRTSCRAAIRVATASNHRAQARGVSPDAKTTGVTARLAGASKRDATRSAQQQAPRFPASAADLHARPIPRDRVDGASTGWAPAQRDPGGWTVHRHLAGCGKGRQAAAPASAMPKAGRIASGSAHPNGPLSRIHRCLPAAVLSFADFTHVFAPAV